MGSCRWVPVPAPLGTLWHCRVPVLLGDPGGSPALRLRRVSRSAGFCGIALPSYNAACFSLHLPTAPQLLGRDLRAWPVPLCFLNAFSTRSCRFTGAEGAPVRALSRLLLPLFAGISAGPWALFIDSAATQSKSSTTVLVFPAHSPREQVLGGK